MNDTIQQTRIFYVNKYTVYEFRNTCTYKHTHKQNSRNFKKKEFRFNKIDYCLNECFVVVIVVVRESNLKIDHTHTNNIYSEKNHKHDMDIRLSGFKFQGFVLTMLFNGKFFILCSIQILH